MADILHLDLPMDEDAHSRVEENDRTEHENFAPLTYDHRAQHLAAELEAQRERNALRHGEPCMRLIFTKSDNALRAGKQENDRSRSLQKNDPELHKVL